MFTKCGPRQLGRDSLRAGTVSGSNPGGGARFHAPVQTGARPTQHRVFPREGVNRPGRGVDHPLPSSAEDKERVELYLYSTAGHSLRVRVWTLHLPLLLTKYHSSDHIEEDQMGWACGTRAREEKCIQSFDGDTRRKGPAWGDSGVDKNLLNTSQEMSAEPVLRTRSLCNCPQGVNFVDSQAATSA